MRLTNLPSPLAGEGPGEEGGGHGFPDLGVSPGHDPKARIPSGGGRVPSDTVSTS